MYGALFLATVGIGMLSCEKVVPQVKEKATDGEVVSNSETKVSSRPAFFDNGVNYGCEGTGGNCLPMVTIRPKSLHHSIDNIINSNDDPNVVRNEFQSHKKLYLEICSQNAVNGILDGSLTLETRGAIGVPNGLFFKFFDINSNEMIEVQPLK